MVSLFHFIGVTERFDESLVVRAHGAFLRDSFEIASILNPVPSFSDFELMVDLVVKVMKNLFNLTNSDILYLPAKVAGTSGAGAHTLWTNESEAVQVYGRGQEFYARNRLDFMLHAHVNAILDAQIAAIPDFGEQLDQFRVSIPGRQCESANFALQCKYPIRQS